MPGLIIAKYVLYGVALLFGIGIVLYTNTDRLYARFGRRATNLLYLGAISAMVGAGVLWVIIEVSDHVE